MRRNLIVGSNFYLLLLQYILKDMADMLGVTSSMLSSVENGKKSVPLDWEEIIIIAYNLNEDQKEELHHTILDSVKQIRLDIKDDDHERTDLAVSFARNFDELNEERIKEILGILESKGD
jgi:transcriptional regulator with XRE-family HTH domain